MKRVLSLVCFMYACICCTAQTITTIGGTGSLVCSGDNGPATVAGITNPTYGAFDGSGNYIFCDYNAKRIRRIDPSGIITTIAGNGLGTYTGDGSVATATGIDRPHSVKLDTLGNLYITQHNNNVIRKVDISSGIITTIAGTGLGTFSGDGGPATAASLWDPQDVAIDKWGNLYIADMYNYRVRKVDAMGIITTVAGTGVMAFGGDGGPATDAQLAFPGGVAVDDTGNLYVADASSFSCRVRKINTSGIITTIAGNGGSTYAGDGVPATLASMAPFTVALDAHNNIFISDRYNHRVYKVDNITGLFYCIAGNGLADDGGDGGLATSASLHTPTGVAIDKCDNVYIPTIGDITIPSTGRRIRKITYSTASIADIGISVFPNDSVCAGTVVTYTASVTSGSTGGYQWYKNSVAITGATNVTYTYTPTGGDDIYCVYTGIDVCSFSGMPSSNVVHMVVTPLALPTITLTGPASATIGSTVTVNATVSGTGSSYTIKWYKNSALFNTSTVPITTYVKATGTDVIAAKVSSTDVIGCYDTTTSDGYTILVGPNEVGNKGILPLALAIHPNPANDVLYIDGEVSTYRVLSVVGAVLLEEHAAKPVSSIGLSLLAPGMYILDAIDAQGVRTVTRFVKR